MDEVLIGREQREVARDGKLRDECIDRAQLDTAAPARIAEFGRVLVVAPPWFDDAERAEVLADRPLRALGAESAQEFRQDRPPTCFAPA